jgi:PAS domain S-box-containing protein
MMPGLDGLDVCRRVRQRVETVYTYILLLTSLDRKEDVVAGMESGADDYLTKPFDPDELQVRLRAGTRILDQESLLRESLNDHQHVIEMLTEQRTLLRNIIDNIPDQVYIKDIDGRYLEVNVAHMRLLGAMMREDVLGRTTSEFLPQETSGSLLSDHPTVFNWGKPLYDQVETITDWTGSTRCLSTTMLPLQGAQGQIVALLCLSRKLPDTE